ncbi:hypothetical protein A2311_00370 [candidate division WOR-1 bacterium RIFOXYB2_FULL_48_7]|uniref:SbsA Ig-like domain-containing protein n=1 Tax=candidate division WOR-1 bacterium RIFOXYB2_FULL_48_7 TaxID=1802583 RepID=A0A1F4TRI8_UNCSA|nr:MAG: hypothetical protein A2311_00370 [candidate division WOR-1 bacterium RIFOXYB2_FULL_48_7]
MKKSKRKFLERWLGVLFACLFLTTSAHAYAGKIFIANTALTTASLGNAATAIIKVYSDVPYQDGSTTELPESAYELDKTSNPAYVIVNVKDSSKATAFILVKSDSRYAITSKPLGDPVGADQIILTLVSYQLGKPAAPTIDSLASGIEVAKVSWSYDYANFEYSGGFALEISDKSDYSNPIGGAKIIGKLSSPMTYTIGELVDGRKLEPGKSYYLRLRGIVNMSNGVKANSDWSTPTPNPFTMLAAGTAGPSIVSWQLSAPTSKTSVNTIAIPFVTNSAQKPVTFTAPGKQPANLSAYTTGAVTVYDLLAATSQLIAPAKISSFGWYDEAEQKHVGLVAITYDQNGDPIPAQTVFTGAANYDSILNTKIVQNKPYQISIKDLAGGQTTATFSLTGYKD